METGEVAAQPVRLGGQCADRDPKIGVDSGELAGLRTCAAGMDDEVFDAGEDAGLGDRLGEDGLEPGDAFEEPVLVLLLGTGLGELLSGDGGVGGLAGADRLGEAVDASDWRPITR